MPSATIYDLLLTAPCKPSDLALTLAVAFSLPLSDVDVAEEDTEDRNWSAPVLATYGERHGDIALSLSITTVLDVAPLTEPALAARLADHLATPILYPAASFPPSAYWLTDASNPDHPTRARLEPSNELDPTITDDLALTISAVNRPVPALPHVLVTPIPEVIREHRLPTPLANAFPGNRQARNALAAWESFVTRLTSGWPPDAWYPAAYYAEDLESRDTAAQLALTLTPNLASALATALRTPDAAYIRATIPDNGTALSHALGLPATALAARAPHWHRRPADLPWLGTQKPPGA